jgi:hypothetical protein
MVEIGSTGRRAFQTATCAIFLTLHFPSLLHVHQIAGVCERAVLRAHATHAVRVGIWTESLVRAELNTIAGKPPLSRDRISKQVIE